MELNFVLIFINESIEQVEIDKGELKKLTLLAADTVGILMKKATKKKAT